MRFIAIALIVFLCTSCTYRHLNEIVSPFPPTTKTAVNCRTYAGFQEAAAHRREMENKGWYVTSIGDKETSVFILLRFSEMVICYEKPEQVLSEKGEEPVVEEQTPANE